MMKKLVIALVALLLVNIAAVQSAGLVNSYRMAVIGGTRPTLVSTGGDFNAANDCTRTISVTPPVGTSLIVVYGGASRESAHASFDFATITMNGTDLIQLTSFATNSSNEVYDGIAYRINPTTGVSQNIVMTSVNCNVAGEVNWNSSFLYAWMFSGTDGADPFGLTLSGDGASIQGITLTGAPEYNRPYIVSGSVASRNSGAGNCYSATNLTIDSQSAESDENVAGASAHNSSLTAAGSTSFTMFCSYPASGGTSMELTEVKGP